MVVGALRVVVVLPACKPEAAFGLVYEGGHCRMCGSRMPGVKWVHGEGKESTKLVCWGSGVNCLSLRRRGVACLENKRAPFIFRTRLVV